MRGTNCVNARLCVFRVVTCGTVQFGDKYINVEILANINEMINWGDYVSDN